MKRASVIRCHLSRHLGGQVKRGCREGGRGLEPIVATYLLLSSTTFSRNLLSINFSKKNNLVVFFSCKLS